MVSDHFIFVAIAIVMIFFTVHQIFKNLSVESKPTIIRGALYSMSETDNALCIENCTTHNIGEQ